MSEHLFPLKRSSCLLTIFLIFGVVGLGGLVIAKFLDWELPFWPREMEQSTSAPASPTVADEDESTVKVIDSKGTYILYNQVKMETGTECDKAPHYHAAQGGEAQSLDGKMIKDPGGCGYGKVSETPVREMSY